MANHNKPTKAELQAGMQASLDKLKNLPPEETPPAPTPPTPTPPAPSGEPTPPTPPVPPTPPTPPTPDPATPPAPTPPTPTPPAPSGEPAPTPTPAQVDWEKKFKESSAEVQVRMFKEKELEKAEEEAAALPEPTPEEMKELYPNFDELDKVTQNLAKDNLLSKRRNEIIKKAKDKFKQIEDWNGKVLAFVDDPKTLIAYPELEGKIDDFKAFANKPTRRGLEFEDLILAFRGELAVKAPAPKTGQMFEPGSAGPSAPPTPKDDKLSIEEGAALKKTDYKKYVEFLKAGKIRLL